MPNPFVLVVQLEEPPGFPNPAHFGSDHPAAGPTGPQACGICYPTNRVTHSFRFGPTHTPFCPGVPIDDGICDAEFFWDLTFACATGVDESSWGKVKTLYK